MEQDLEIDVVVRVNTFGDPDKVLMKVLLEVARVCGHALPNDEEKPMMVSLHRATAGGLELDPHSLSYYRWYRYDAFGDDMGNHVGHDQPLIPVGYKPKGNTNGPQS